MIVYEDELDLYLVHEDDVFNPMADCQLYNKATGKLFDQIKPLGIWLKFSFYLEEVDPPEPFTPEAADLRVRIYKAAKRAREAAEEK